MHCGHLWHAVLDLDAVLRRILGRLARVRPRAAQAPCEAQQLRREEARRNPAALISQYRSGWLLLSMNFTQREGVTCHLQDNGR